MLKMEIEIPEGTTKIDIGPILEPLLARLVRIERMSGYKDLHGDDRYTWRRVEDCDRPVLSDDVDRWVKWVHDQRELQERMAGLTHKAITTFLTKEGWTRNERTREEEADYDYSSSERTPRSETWTYSFMVRPGWGGSRRPYESNVKAHVPFPQRYEKAQRIHKVLSLIYRIKEARKEGSWTTSSIGDLLLEIENCIHPLSHLADCAEETEPPAA